MLLMGDSKIEETQQPHIPFEFVDSQEMEAIEVALVQAASLSSLGSTSTCSSRSVSQLSVKSSYGQSEELKTYSSILSIKDHKCGSNINGYYEEKDTNLSSQKLLAAETARHVLENIETHSGDTTINIEDIEELAVAKSLRKKLYVTDVTALEWCEKQFEFTLIRGKPKKTVAMKVGSDRHQKLEMEVVTRVEVEVLTQEDHWAMRFINFILGTRQLFMEGLTRELPIVGFVEGTWFTGVIDELRLSDTGQPFLVDTKTRASRSPPSEAQKRNGRLQLMCYKLLWDTMVQTGVPAEILYNYFGLNPKQVLSDGIKCHIGAFGYQVEYLEDIVALFIGECVTLPTSHRSLLLRYEWQADQSLLGENEFLYDSGWLMDCLQWHLQYWHGRRSATYVPEGEGWKCNFCSFSEVCSRAQRANLSL